MSRRRRPTSSRPLVVPARPEQPPVEPNRVTIGPNTVRAGWEAHRGDEHAGQIGRDCRTCARYSAALVDAHVREREHGEAFEVPTSAANAYASLVRRHTGGLVTSPSPAPPAPGATGPSTGSTP